jgi:hypothetical protein
MITSRRPRPIKREITTYRDDKLFIIACDDTYAVKQYFNFFKISRIQIHVIPSDAKQSAAYDALERLREIDHLEDDELWMLLDTDHYIFGEHLGRFTQTLSEAKQSNIHIALSRPCFEIWLLLHHVNNLNLTDLNNADKVEKKLRDVLGEYNKCNLKKDHYPIEKVADAIRNAERIDTNVKGNEIPDSATTRVYLLWKSIINSLLPSQLPQSLSDSFLI